MPLNHSGTPRYRIGRTRTYTQILSPVVISFENPWYSIFHYYLSLSYWYSQRDLNPWPWMYKIPALTNWAMWVYWGVRWDLNPCHKEPQSSALPDWATNTVLIERLELSTTALWEQPSTIEVHQLLLFLTNVGMVRIELTCNQLLFQLLIRQRRYIPICWEGRNWTHNYWFWRPVFYQLNYFPIT